MDRNRDEKDLGEQGVDDSTRGKMDKFKGHLKDAAGGLTGDSSLQAEGKVDELKGKVKDTLGRGERELDRSIDRNIDRSADRADRSLDDDEL